MKIGIISDIHSNLPALNCTLQFLENKIDTLIVAGDIVGYGPQPAECLDRLIDFSVKEKFCILGNHDLGVRSAYCNLNGLNNCSEDNQLLKLFKVRPSAEAMFQQNALDLEKEHHNFLVKLPIKSNFKLGTKLVYLTHGTPSKKKSDNIGRYLSAPPIQSSRISIDNAKRFKGTRKSDLVIIGHSHQRFYINRNLSYGWSYLSDRYSNTDVKFPQMFSFKEDKLIINPGSVGQPRDGNPDASFVILDLEAQRVTFESLKYSREKYYKIVKERCDPSIQDSSFWEIKF